MDEKNILKIIFISSLFLFILNSLDIDNNELATIMDFRDEVDTKVPNYSEFIQFISHDNSF